MTHPQPRTIQILTAACGAAIGLGLQLVWLRENFDVPYERHENLRLMLGPLVGIAFVFLLRRAVETLLATRLDLEQSGAQFRRAFAWALLPPLAGNPLLAAFPGAGWVWPLLLGLSCAALFIAGKDVCLGAWNLQPWRLGTGASSPPRKDRPSRPRSATSQALRARVDDAPLPLQRASMRVALRHGWSGPVPLLAAISLALQGWFGYLSGIGNDDLSVYYVRWGRELLEWGPAQFYMHSNCDYTPIYVYLLGISAALESLLGLTSENAIGLAYKLPPIASVFLLYSLCLLVAAQMRPVRPEKPALSAGSRTALACLILLNPAMIYISSFWGQSDPTMLCIVMAMFLAILANRLFPTLLLAFVGVLFKPQMVFALPFLLAWCLWRFPVRRLVLATVAAVAVGVASILPFLINLDPDWLITFYRDTAGVFHLTSLNAGTLIGLLGGNMADDRLPSLVGLSYVDLSLLLLAGLFLLFGTRLKAKIQGGTPQDLLYLLAFSLLMVYYFSTRMHSRYLVYGLAPMLLYLTLHPGRGRLALAWGLSLALFWQMITHFPITLWEGFWTPQINETIPIRASFLFYSLATLAGVAVWVRIGVRDSVLTAPPAARP